MESDPFTFLLIRGETSESDPFILYMTPLLLMESDPFTFPSHLFVGKPQSLTPLFFI
jgi:hypothetical protein